MRTDDYQPFQKPRLAGNTTVCIGTRVRIKGITDEYDKDLNGRTGILCRPWPDQRPIQDVGVRLDDIEGEKSEFVNIHRHEFEVIREEEEDAQSIFIPRQGQSAAAGYGLDGQYPVWT